MGAATHIGKIAEKKKAIIKHELKILLAFAASMNVTIRVRNARSVLTPVVLERVSLHHEDSIV